MPMVRPATEDDLPAVLAIYNEVIANSNGLGLFWDKTSSQAVGQPTRDAEWEAELYCDYTLFKTLC